MDRNLSNKIFEELFRKRQGTVKVKVFMKSSKSIGTNYDPFRNTNYTKTKQNPIFIQALVRDVSPEKLIYKEMGVSETGAKELVIHSRDVNAIKISERIEIDGENYYIYNDRVGNKLQIFKRSFDYYRVIIFRRLK